MYTAKSSMASLVVLLEWGVRVGVRSEQDLLCHHNPTDSAATGEHFARIPGAGP